MSSSTRNKHHPRQSRNVMLGLAGLITLTGMMLVAHGLWIPAKAQFAQFLLERAWAKSLQTGQIHKAWSWADSWPVAQLSIPSLGLKSIILKEAGGEGLAFGPVLLNQSAQPGSNGSTIISAHRDTHFKALKDINIGDKLSLTSADGLKFDYEITHSRIAQWDQSGLSADGYEPELVLVSCWPFDSITPTDQRFILHAKQTSRTQIASNAPTDRMID